MLRNAVATEVTEVTDTDNKSTLGRDRKFCPFLIVDNTTGSNDLSGLTTGRDEVIPYPAIGEPQKTSGNLARISIAFNFCKDTIIRAIDTQDDLILKANAMAELQTGLDQLWKERIFREQLFGDLINILQGLFLEIEPLDISKEQLESIKKVLFEASDLTTFSKADIKEYLKILNKAGCDVYRTLG